MSETATEPIPDPYICECGNWQRLRKSGRNPLGAGEWSRKCHCCGRWLRHFREESS